MHIRVKSPYCFNTSANWTARAELQHCIKLEVRSQRLETAEDCNRTRSTQAERRSTRPLLLSLPSSLLPFFVAAFRLLMRTVVIPPERPVNILLQTRHLKKQQKASFSFSGMNVWRAIYWKCTRWMKTSLHSTDKDLDASLLLLFHGTKK